MQSQPDADARAAELLTRLLTDPQFRASFRQDPAAACEAYGRPDLARELAGGGKALFTLEIRESRSSLAGAFIAAAREGADVAGELARMHSEGGLSDQAAQVVDKALTSAGLSAVQSVSAAGPFAGRGLFTAWDPSTAVNAPGVDWVAVRPDHLTAALADQIRGAGKRLIVWEDTASPAGIDAVHAYGASGYIAQAEGPDQLAAAEALADKIDVPKAIVTNNFAPQLPSGWVALVEAYQNANPNETPARVVADALNRGAQVAIPILGTYDAAAEQPGAGGKVSLAEYADELKGLQLPGVGAYTAESMDSDDLAAFGQLSYAGDPAAAAEAVPAPAAPPVDVPSAPPAHAPATPVDVPAPRRIDVAASHRADPAGAVSPERRAAAHPPDLAEPRPEAGVQEHAAPSAPAAPATPPAPPDDAAAPAPVAAAVDLSAVPAAAAPDDGVHRSVVLAALGDHAGPSGAHSTLQFLPQVDDVHDAIAPTAALDTYPGDNASPGAIAAWMGVQAHRAGLPAELPVMAGLTESGLRNLNYGDRDSVGFFQMRLSVWGDQYPDFGRRPELQLKWFIDSALEVKRQWLAEGRGADLQDPSKFGEWVADVERPAAEYRQRYAEHLAEAQQLLRANGPGAGQQLAAASAPAPGAPAAVAASQPAAEIEPGTAGGVEAEPVAVTPPVPIGGGLEQMTVDGIPATGSPAALRALEAAFSFKGTPYHWGGSSPDTGFDCSGLTQFAWKQAGYDISRTTYTQIEDGVAVEPDVDHLQAGDLLFFRDSSGDNHHVGMYIGNHQFIQAPHTGDVVKVSSLDEPYYKEQFFAARRIAPGDGAGVGAVELAPAASAPADPVAAAADVAEAAPAAGAAPANASGVLAALGNAGRDRGAAANTVQFLPRVDEQPAEPESQR